MQEFLQIIVNGVAQGSVYALVALGYTMVYGVLQFINFAHSDVFMLGTFAGLFAASAIGAVGVETPWLRFVLATIAAMVCCTVVALIVERVAYRPLRRAPRLNVLITAIGVSLFLENIALVFFGSDPRVFPPLLETKSLLGGSELVLNNIQVIVVGVSVALMVALHWFVQKTRTGIAMRAVSYDIEVASLMGVPTDRIIALTFIVGSSLAGAASILYGLSYPKIEPLLGILIGVKAFVAAVFGGIGNIVGAAVGGLLIGLAEAFVVYYVSSSFRDAIAFAILIGVLLIRPAGLFGRVVQEKV